MTGPKRLHELYTNLQKRLDTDLETARAANKNVNIKGDESERTWRQLLDEHLPHRYKAAKGIVIDCNGDESEEIDIIIHDRQYTPCIYNQLGAPYIPAESVYAVLEAKQELDKGFIEYAGEKAESVRKLHRTTAIIPFASGEYSPKKPFRIIAGIVAYKSTWNPPLGDPFRDVIGALNPLEQLDLGIASTNACFEVEYQTGKPSIKIYPAERSLAAFLIRLLARLQALGTVPAIDYNVYGRLLE